MKDAIQQTLAARDKRIEELKLEIAALRAQPVSATDHAKMLRQIAQGMIGELATGVCLNAADILDRQAEKIAELEVILRAAGPHMCELSQRRRLIDFSLRTES